MDGLHVNEARMGYDHVGAQDQANANMSIVGDGVYLDPFFGNKLAMEMTSANTLQIETGAVWANGHYVDLDHAVELQIANGKTANKRHDLVCIKCTISDLGGENQLDNYDLVVIQGTQTTGTPADPEVPTEGLTDKVAESYAVIARVVLDGLTPSVEKLLHTVPSLMTPIEAWQFAAGAVDNRALSAGSVSFEKITPFARAQIADETISTLGSGGIENSVLRVSISNPSSQLNAPGRVIKDPSKNLNPTDLPSALASETIVYANRRVQWLDTGICAVWLFESYPKTRIWKNVYYSGWKGWELVNWDSISQRARTESTATDSYIGIKRADNQLLRVSVSDDDGGFLLFASDSGLSLFDKSANKTTHRVNWTT